MDDELEWISETGTASDEWVREGSALSCEESPKLGNNEKETDSAVAATSSKVALKITAELVNLLGVRNKPDPLADWDNLYNLPQQSELRSDCRNVMAKIGDKTIGWTLPQVESLMTLYCKRRNVGYDSEQCWMDILSKLLLLPFDHCALFNVFWAITTKYVPRSTKMFDLYRLLLQYHDPKLCSFLDSFRIHPEHFTKDWFCSLLSKDIDAELCWAIWKKYFEKGDPYLIFFIALALAQGVREEIFLLKDRSEIIVLLKKQPCRMVIEDVDDLLEICFVHLNLTPISVREDFHCMLFGSNLVDEFSEIPLNHLICLPISIQELYRRAIDSNPLISTSISPNFGYFVVDTRPQKSFNAGCIPGSYNLNAETIVEDPEKFNIAMSSLMKFKEDNYPKDHICFLGSGREEEDQFTNLAIAKFLQQNFEHTSYAGGGYRGLHQMLSDAGNLAKLSNHFKKNECAECNAEGQKGEGKRNSLSFLERLRKSIPSGAELYLKKATNSKSTRNEEIVRHVNSTDRFGKRYRNVKSVFSINNEDDSQSSDGNELKNELLEEIGKTKERLNWSEVVKKAEIGEHFEGEEVMGPEGKHIPCYIGLSKTHMHIFHKIDEQSDTVHPSLRHPLFSVMRVTSKRRFPEFLTFKFGYEMPTGESHINRVHYFILPKAGECAKAVKLAIISLTPPSINNETLSES